MRYLVLIVFLFGGWVGVSSATHAAPEAEAPSAPALIDTDVRPKPLRSYRGFRVKRQKRKAAKRAKRASRSKGAQGRSDNSYLLKSQCKRGKARKR